MADPSGGDPDATGSERPASDDDVDPARRALLRWIQAINSPGDRAAVEAAVHPTIRAERFGFGKRRGELVEIIEGPGPIKAWIERTPGEVAFDLADGPAPAPPGEEGFVARYRFDSESFVGAGEWRIRLAPDGRIRFLAHHPDDLPEDAVEQALARMKSRQPGDRGEEST